jgi:hypothetical protein
MRGWLTDREGFGISTNLWWLVPETLPHFLRYTFSPTFSSRFGMVTFPSVEAMMIVFPDADGPNSFERSTLIVSIVPSTVISTFFIMVAFQCADDAWSTAFLKIEQTLDRNRPWRKLYRQAGRKVNRRKRQTDAERTPYSPRRAMEG